MKQSIFIGIALLALACSDPKINEEKQYSFSEITENLGSEYDQMLAEIKAYGKSLVQTNDARSVQTDPFYQFFATMDEYEYARIPIYKLDLEKFYENPSEENLQEYMFPTDEMMLAAMKNGKMGMRIFAEKRESGWCITSTGQAFGEVIGWLRDSLYHAGTKDYKLFTIGGREWITYDKDGEHCYFRSIGISISPAKLCEHCVNTYNRMLEEQKEILEHPEIFPYEHKRLMEEKAQAEKEKK